tara:strand:- start:481 stop:753 length:273 start_codon:yes stop_codon:yes gene_type:complete
MSKETKFTKGIWSLRHDLIGVVDHSDTQSYGMMLNICSMDSWDFKEEWESNAQLIAAAPKMYKFLDDLANGRGTDYPIQQLLAEVRGESI